MERMDGRTDATEGRGRSRTDGGREERPGEQVMLFRGRTDARTQREREREEGTVASVGAAPALPVKAEYGRRRPPPPPGGHNGDQLPNEVGRVVLEPCIKRRKKGYFISLVAGVASTVSHCTQS